MMKEYSRVRTLVEKNGFPAGSIGVIVSFYSTGPACEVEIWDKDMNPVDVVTYSLDELEEVEITD